MLLKRQNTVLAAFQQGYTAEFPTRKPFIIQPTAMSIPISLMKLSQFSINKSLTLTRPITIIG